MSICNFVTVCDLCKTDIDNLEHRLWKCTCTQQFWSYFNDYYGRKCHKTINKDLVLLGDDNALLCTLIFAAKRFIQQSFVREEVPNFQHFVKHVVYLQNIEKEIHWKNFSIDTWKTKWQPLL